MTKRPQGTGTKAGKRRNSRSPAEGSVPAHKVYALAQTLWRQVNAEGAMWVDEMVRLRARMTHPQPGDVVVEVSTLAGGFDPSRLGTFVSRHRDSWVIRSSGGAEVGFEGTRFVAVPCRGDGWPALTSAGLPS
jgi:hypothetical protein